MKITVFIGMTALTQLGCDPHINTKVSEISEQPIMNLPLL